MAVNLSMPPTTGKRLTGVYARLSERFAEPRVLYPALAILLLLSLSVPLYANDYYQVILTNAFLYAVLALGLNVVVGYAGLLDLGYAAFFAVGAYTTGILTQHFGFSFWETIPCAIIAAAIAGVIIGGPTLRLRSDYLAIVTLGFGEIVRLIARNLDITGAATGLVGIPSPSFFGHVLSGTTSYYYIFLVLVVLAIFVSHRLLHSRLGRAWFYVRYDEDAAEAMGINKVRVKLSAYVIGAIIGSIGGVFFAANLGAISPPAFKFHQSVLVLMAVILGGMGRIPGVVLGAFIVILGPELLRPIGSYRLLVFALFMLAIMLFRPSGVWPQRSK